MELEPDPALTHGTLLGGRVRYAQLTRGHRTGIEPVLLAASVTPRPGQRVIEGGTGAGAALLCVAHRFPEASSLGIERDPALAELAAANAAANGARIEVLAADLLDLPNSGLFDHAISNPPWHRHAGTPSPDGGRDLAKRAPAGLLASWVASLARVLRHRGTLTLVLSAAQAAEALAVLPPVGLGSPALLPLWPRTGTEAKLCLLRAVRGGAGPCRILPGLALHGQDGRYTPAVNAILHDAAPLDGFTA